MRLLTPLLALTGFAGLGVSQATQTIVIPNGAATTEGNNSNLFPWGRGGAGLRLQCLYDSTNFTAQGVPSPIRITRLRFRPDASIGRTWNATSYQSASVSLSTCPADYTAPSTTFAANVGSDRTVVFSGPVAWAAGSSATPGPAPFLIDLPLSTPFLYDPNAGDLNIDTDLPVQTFAGSNLPIDVQTTGATCSRVFLATGYPNGPGTVNVNHGVVVEVSYDVLAQEPLCRASEREARLANTVPGYRAARQRLVADINTRIQVLRASPANRYTQEFVIPVVVHVVWRTAAERIGLAQIQSQIDALNRDFSASNIDISNVPSDFAGVTASPGIRFVLAQRAPGCSATNGVTYRQTNVVAFTWANDEVKSSSTGGADPWPSTDYLNIWVCNLLPGQGGWGTFPGGPPLLDGIVVDNGVFGTTSNVSPPYNLGRVCVHEVGHWLDLYHTFHDDVFYSGGTGSCATSNDQVDDTPRQWPWNNGCPAHPHASCTSADMFMNYMDYTFDACKVMFSVGQSLRMEATLSVARASLQDSQGHIPPGVGTPDLWIADDVLDIGNEPNTESSVMWASSDIWIRHAPDGGLVHQNPNYGAVNYIHVRVRNRACADSDEAWLRLYWAKASVNLGWEDPWTGNVTLPALMGNMIGNLHLNPGEVLGGASRTYVFAWVPPDPALYASFGADRAHFCLLARVLTSLTPPYGMTVPEAVGDLYGNTKNNNNIAWKNITIMGEGSGMIHDVLASNYSAQAKVVRFAVDLGRGAPANLPANALRIKLSDALLQKWVAGGARSFGVRVTSQNMFEILQDGAWLGNITLDPNDVLPIQVRVGPGLLVGPKRTMVVRLEQRQEANLAIMGGEDFVLPIGVNYESGHTSSFGLGCAGTGGLRPVLSAAAAPVIGSPFTLRVSRARASSPGALFLSPVGAVRNLFGCNIYVGDPMVSLGVITDETGSGSIAVPIPLNPAYLSASVTLQGMVVDPGGTFLGRLSTTNGLEAVIGR